MAVALFLSPSPALADAVLDACAAPSLPPLVDAASLNDEQLGLALKAAADEIDGLAAAMPKLVSDPMAAATVAGFDGTMLARWVDANIVLRPYRGVLGGARGAFLTRQGNSLDRALVLAEMVKLAGFDTRLARRTLSREQAAALLPRTQLTPALPSGEAVVKGAGIATLPGAVAAALDQVPGTLARAGERCQVAVKARIQEQSARLAALATQASPASSNREDAVLEALADHWWVQADLGQGWVDLDPAADVIVKAPAAATFDPARLPDDLFHRVRVTVEATAAGGRPTMALDQTLRAADVLFQPVRLGLLPVELPRAAPRATPEETAQAVLNGVEAWIPTLRVLGKELARNQIGADGRVSRPGTTRQQDVGGIGQSLGGALGGGLTGRRSDPAPASGGRLERVVLKLQVSTPMKAGAVHVRTLIDPAAGTYLLDSEIAVMAGSPAPAFAAAQIGAARAASYRTAASALLGETAGGENAADVSGGLLWALGRLALTGSPPPDVAPSLVLFHHGVMGRQGTIGVDIIENGGRATASATDSLAHGVADTVVETVMLRDVAQASNTSLTFAANAEGWRLMTTREAAAGLPEGLRDAVIRDIAAGYRIIAPTAATSGRAYWRVDPATNVALGVGPDGHGQATSEYSNLIRYAVTLKWFLACGVLNSYGKLDRSETGLCLLGALGFHMHAMSNLAGVAALTDIAWIRMNLALLFGYGLWQEVAVREKGRDLVREKAGDIGIALPGR